MALASELTTRCRHFVIRPTKLSDALLFRWHSQKHRNLNEWVVSIYSPVRYFVGGAKHIVTTTGRHPLKSLSSLVLLIACPVTGSVSLRFVSGSHNNYCGKSYLQIRHYYYYRSWLESPSIAVLGHAAITDRFERSTL